MTVVALPIARRDPRPEATRQRLIDAGLRLFGDAGREGVSTRTLAETAGVSLNAIQYHFGGKEHVYREVARFIVATSGVDLRRAAAAAGRGARTMSPVEAAASAGALLRDVARIILTAPDAASRGAFILREQLQPTDAFDLLHDGFVREVHEQLTALVMRANGLPPRRRRQGVIRAHALLGHALVFGLARATLSRQLGIDAIDAGRIDDILDEVAQTTVAALSARSAKGRS